MLPERSLSLFSNLTVVYSDDLADELNMKFLLGLTSELKGRKKAKILQKDRNNHHLLKLSPAG